MAKNEKLSVSEHFRRFDERDWGRYQDEARRHADDARWRHFRAAPQPQWRQPPQRGPQGRDWQREQGREPHRDRRDDRRDERRDDRNGH